MAYFFDSYAIIELINQNENYLKFEKEDIFTNSLNVSEVFYYLLRSYDKKTADFWISRFNFNLFEIDLDIAVEAARFKYENKKLKLSFADCIGYILALKNNMRFLTGDEGFKGMKHVEFVK